MLEQVHTNVVAEKYLEENNMNDSHGGRIDHRSIKT